MFDEEYIESPKVCYEDAEEGDIYFVRVCPTCGRFVRADASIRINFFGDMEDAPNATCNKCGRVKMPFWYRG